MRSPTRSKAREDTRRKAIKSGSFRGKAAKSRTPFRGDHSRSSVANQLRDFTWNEIGVVDHVHDANCVYLDMDSNASPSIRPLYAVFRIVGVRPLWIEYRRTARGWHVIVYLRDSLLPAETIALQCCCGSDKRREALNLMRLLAIRRTPITSRFWRRRWNILFSRKLR